MQWMWQNTCNVYIHNFDCFRFVWLMQRRRRKYWKRSLGSWTNLRMTHCLKWTSIKRRWAHLWTKAIMYIHLTHTLSLSVSLSPSLYSFSSGMFGSCFLKSRGWLWPTLDVDRSTSPSFLSLTRRTFASLGWRSNHGLLSSSLVS